MLKNTREKEKVEWKEGKIRRGEGSEGEGRRGERMGGGEKGLNNLIWLKHCI